jgi:hypothetical protein
MSGASYKLMSWIGRGERDLYEIIANSVIDGLGLPLLIAAHSYREALVLGFVSELLELPLEAVALEPVASPPEGEIFSVRWDVLLMRYLTISPVINFA